MLQNDFRVQPLHQFDFLRMGHMTVSYSTKYCITAFMNIKQNLKTENNHRDLQSVLFYLRAPE